jgi:membrane-associated protease RseP (regulator of RpoE activity)
VRAPATMDRGSPPPGTPEEGQGGPPDQRRANHWPLVRLVVGVAVVVALFLLAGLWPLLVVITAVIVMVMVHELGHFLAAKWGRMKVTEYFVGFGPRIWSIRRGETEYGIKAIPAGGYVKIPGMSTLEEIDPADEDRTYRRQPFHKRIVVGCAGSFMHFVMAFLLAFGALLYFGAPTSAVTVQIGGLVHWPGHVQNAAQQGGLEVGDKVVAVNGHRVTTVRQFEGPIQHSATRPVRLTVERHGRLRHLTVVPVRGHTTATGDAPGPGKDQRGIIGVTLDAQTVLAPEGVFPALGTAGKQVGSETAAIVRAVPHGFGSLFTDAFSTKAADQSAANGTRPESIVGAVRTATQAEQQGVLDLIWILIALNVAFGLLNMLPMLPLDGGHVAIAVYERIRTRRGRPYYQADVQKLLPVVYAFVAVLGVVVLTALYLDVAHPVANPFR